MDNTFYQFYDASASAFKHKFCVIRACCSQLQLQLKSRCHGRRLIFPILIYPGLESFIKLRWIVYLGHLVARKIKKFTFILFFVRTSIICILHLPHSFVINTDQCKHQYQMSAVKKKNTKLPNQFSRFPKHQNK